MLIIIFYYRQVEMKRCYYEVLEVDRKATPAEIKTVHHHLLRTIVRWP